ncbi:MAG: type II toxin-antitoxin system RelE/ParE family toxin, partial [Planctomycetota bacterium]
MSRYTVEVTETAMAAIAAQASYIAIEARAPGNAQKWLGQVWDAIDSLDLLPHRARRAEEDEYVAYEVRQLVVGSHLLLFRIDEDRKSVFVVGLRHGHRLPRPGELPTEPDVP